MLIGMDEPIIKAQIGISQIVTPLVRTDTFCFRHRCRNLTSDKTKILKALQVGSNVLYPGSSDDIALHMVASSNSQQHSQIVVRLLHLVVE